MTATATGPVTDRVDARLRRSYRVTGVVQGVGFRPFVYAAAARLGLTGSVRNDAAGVEVDVEGDPAAVAELARLLAASPPPLAVVESVTGTDAPVRGGTGFAIADSGGPAGGRTLAGPDVGTCGACRAELADPADRRYRHPFVSCTDCGPRFTIMTGLPYDRPATTMAAFPLCGRCAREYVDPADRRFHAQTIGCHDCGPRLELIRPGHEPRHREEALTGARATLAAGGIVAVKGLGGYHLACDATDPAAVAELRRRKRRGDKPFALMVRDLAAARAVAHVGALEADLLTGPRRPVVLLARRADPDLPVAEGVAPGSPDLGVVLVYTPVHELLLGLPGDPPGPQVLVMTSGNLGGEPIAFTDDDALHRLAPLADAWLRHDRGIRVPCDDSVTRVVDGEELPVRRSRGYAPLPVALPLDVPAVLATGGDLKNTCCVAEGRYAWLSQHVGDMDDLATLEAFDATQAHLARLVGVTPRTLVADAHPGYRSTQWAQRSAAPSALRSVQHHHAHVAAVMGEHGLDGGQRVVGVAYDGTGYGTDGAVWGGEVLVADYAGFRRFAHLAYVPLPGGDAAVHRPYRMALAHLAAAGVAWDADLPPVQTCPDRELDVVRHQVATGLGCTPTSSMGRLFDAVASLAGVRHVVDFEAQAAIELEALARGVIADRTYVFAVEGGEGADGTLGPGDDGGPLTADAAPVVRAVVADVRAGVPGPLVSARFHAGVATLTRDLAVAASNETGLRTVVLGGGVFGNAVLLSATCRLLCDAGLTVLRPHRLPPNDGGLALGQVLVGSSC